MEKSIEQLQEANAALSGLLADLASAKARRRSWEQHDLEREDGSSVQDARHNDEGDRLQDELRHASHAVKAQISVLKKLGDAL